MSFNYEAKIVDQNVFYYDKSHILIKKKKQNHFI